MDASATGCSHNQMTQTLTYRIAWARCKHGHDMTDHANVYIVPATGQRRCRSCIRKPAKPSKPRRYETWALQAWETMTPSERRLVLNALSELDLEVSR